MSPTKMLLATIACCATIAACNSNSTTGDVGPQDAGNSNDMGTAPDMGAAPDVELADTAPMDSVAPADAPPDSSVSAMQACTDLATARCGMLDVCSGHLGVVRNFGDMATCVNRYTANCITVLSVPMTTATPAFEEACALALTSESCSDFRDGVTSAACVAPAGPLANGTPCVANAQCQSGVCLIANDAQCGTCSAQPPDGADCSVTGCGRNLTCNHNATAGTYTCRVPILAGNTCDADHPCAAGLDCVKPSSTATSGTCTPIVATLGSPCSRNSVVTPGCDAYVGLFCTSMGSCAAETASTVGEPCGPVGGTRAAYCIDGSTCSSGAGGATRMCVAAAADGSPCDTSASIDCFAPSRCVQSAAADAGPDAGTAGTCLALNAAACP